MPNYSYRPNDYVRRNQYGRQIASTPVRIDHEHAPTAEHRENDCCKHDLLNGMPIAMAYVPWQEWHNIYPIEKALCQGTIFEELDKPFLGKGGYIK